MKKTCKVSIAVSGRFFVDVPIPDNMEDKDAVSYAIDEANKTVSEADFGSLEDIDWNICHIKDDDENFIYPGQR